MTDGATGAAQETANKLVDAAQQLGNEVVDLGEEALGTVLSAVLTANRLVGDVLETLAKQISG